MGMRASDVTFLRREIVPILERAAVISPDAREAADMLTERLSKLPEDAPPSIELIEWHRRPLRLHVYGVEIPFLEASRITDADGNEIIDLTIDRRFGHTTTEEELHRWAWFLSRCMQVAAERSAHGERPFLFYTQEDRVAEASST